jgi:hypothetical protein
MTILLVAALAAAQPSPIAPPAPPALRRVNILPPPMITTTAPPAPPSPANYQRAMARLTQPPAILDIRVSGEGGLLWQGSVRVGATGANVHQDRTEAEPANCSRQMPASDHAVRTSFAFGVTSARYVEQEDMFGFNVAWTRLPREESCAAEGSRTVQLQTMIAIPPRASVILHGDAGLSVEIHRR